MCCLVVLTFKIMYTVGYIDSSNASDAHPQWKLFKTNYFEAKSPEDLMKVAREYNLKGIRVSRKVAHATAYIVHLRDSYFGEKFASSEGATKDGKVKNVSILPYESVKQLFSEYELYCDVTKAHVELDRAKISVFRRVFKKMNDSVRLLRCKGSFPTCEICNTANEMLRDKRVSLYTSI